MSCKEIISVADWGIFAPVRPFVIAGPCSAESREQMMRTASELKAEGVSVLRAGIWKPRTHPGCFEGIGGKALPWLVDAGRENGMRTCTEVAGGRHVEACLNAGVDMVWIGARTTANPFLVQEIADALEGTDIPVLVKNPVCPDVNLWTGAVERLALKGVRKIAAVHRGCLSYGGGLYRNDPQWMLSVDFRMKCPGITLFCDPSHMGGRADSISELSILSLDLGFEGLMIEAHCCPSEALSDSSQQITPAELGRILRSLEPGHGSESFEQSASGLRSQIDAIDAELLQLLARRVAVSREIGRLKKDEGVSIVQPQRWNSKLKRSGSDMDVLGLDPASVERIFGAIHEYSIMEQLKIKKQ